jgi:hypothetical protein
MRAVSETQLLDAVSLFCTNEPNHNDAYNTSSGIELPEVQLRGFQLFSSNNISDKIL